MRSVGTGDGASVVSPVTKPWRATIAIRTFGLALATGTVVSHQSGGKAVPLLAALVLIAGVVSSLELIAGSRTVRGMPIAEAGLAAIVLTSGPLHPGLLAYLAIPPIVAGVRHGLVTTVNTVIVAGLTVLATVRLDSAASDLDRLTEAAPWLAIGLGVGLLASWQSRSLRDLEARQAPYAAAHQLMARLHQLAQEGSLGLDSASLAAELDVALRRATGAARCAVFVADADGDLRPIVNAPDSERLRSEIDRPDAERTPGAAVVPLRGANHVLGYCVLTGVMRWSPQLDARATTVADDFALRLDTAVLFEEVRHLATSEERNRIAREMHDGVAQEIVALGYVVDEIESISNEQETRELAEGLRNEISRVVTELRHSIFDLRLRVDDHDLAGALAEYVQEVSQDTGLRVHLVLDSNGPRLPARTRSELMRVAQEAIGNVRRHARAANLWVTYVSDGSSLRLEVADDGIGHASPKDRHWGLQTMKERATSIGAELTIEPRAAGGTVVRLLTRPVVPSEGSAHREHHSPTRR